MAPFVYSPVDYPYVNSIAQLMTRGGDIQAEAAREIGAAQAQGIRGAGQAWGQGIAGAGQNIGQAVQQQTNPQRVLAQQQVNDLRMLDKAYGDASNAGSEDEFRQRVIRALPGHLQGSVQSSFAQADEARAKLNESNLKAEDATNQYVFTLADGIKAHDYDPTALQLALAHAKATFRTNPSLLNQIAPIEAALHANPTPQGVQAIVDPIIKAHEAQEKPVVLPATPRGGAPAQLVRPSGAPVATGTAAPPPPPTPESVALTAAGVQPGEQPTPEQARAAITTTQAPAMAARATEEERAKEQARHNVEVERIQKLQVNREAAMNAETARHNRATEAANNPLAALQAGTAEAGPVGTQGQPQPPSGAEFLATLPTGIQSQVKALAEGRLQFPGGYALRSPYWQAMLQMVGQYDPSFDTTNYNARNKARTDLTSPSGTGGKTINSLNTAIQHAGTLSDLIEALENNNIPAANYIANAWNRATGGTKVTNFEAVQPQLMKEIERAWRGTGGSQTDIDALKGSLGPNQGIQQQREALNQFVNLMKGKIETTETQRDNALGPLAAPQVPVLYPQSQPVLDKIAHRASGTPQAKTLSVTDVERMASLAGTTYDEAKKHAESRGYTVK